MPFAYNVDVKLTDENDASSFQFINMTIESVPSGATQLRGEWRGAPVFLPASSGEFDWDGRPGQKAAFVFEGLSANGKIILGLNDFASPTGGLPGRGSTGGGAVIHPIDPTFLGTIVWVIT